MQPMTDLLTYGQKLKDAGEPEIIANTHVEMLATLIENNLPTKEDLKNETNRLDTRITHEFDRLDARITYEVDKLDTRITHEVDKLDARITHEANRLDTRIDKLDVKFTGKFNLLYWMMGFLLSGMAALLCKAF
jgi:hypothetical protein